MIIGDFVKHESGVMGQITLIIPTLYPGHQWFDIVDDKSIRFRVKAIECTIHKHHTDVIEPFKPGDRVMMMGTVCGIDVAGSLPRLFRVILDIDGVPATFDVHTTPSGAYFTEQNMVLLTRRKPQ
jgi:hypothetical protein